MKRRAFICMLALTFVLASSASATSLEVATEETISITLDASKVGTIYEAELGAYTITDNGNIVPFASADFDRIQAHVTSSKKGELTFVGEVSSKHIARSIGIENVTVYKILAGGRPSIVDTLGPYKAYNVFSTVQSDSISAESGAEYMVNMRLFIQKQDGQYVYRSVNSNTITVK